MLAFAGLREGGGHFARVEQERAIGDLGELHVRMAGARTRERAERAAAEASYKRRIEDERAEAEARAKGRELNWPELYDDEDDEAAE
jgi:hypothetical protein